MKRWLVEVSNKIRKLNELQESITEQLYRGKRAVEILTIKPNSSILLLHDFHIGSADFSVLERIANMLVGKKKFDICVLSEVLDFTSFSPFERERGGDFGQELATGEEMYDFILSYLAKEIHIIPSNHEKRAEKRIRDYLANLPPDAVDAVAEAMRKYISTRYNNKAIIQHDGFYLRTYIGDVWMTHGDRYLLNPGSAGRDIQKKLGSLGLAIGFSYDRAKLIIHAHEHRYNAGIAEGAQILIWSMPACCYVPFYSVNEPPSRYSRYPQALGWGELYFNRRCEIDLEASRLVFYGWQKLPAGCLDSL